MNDIYQQLDKQTPHKVKPRTNDGFTDPNLHQDDSLTPEATSPKSPSPSIAHHETHLVVETSKPKLLTLEIALRKEIDQILYEHPDTSWDTLMESALILSLNSPTSKKRLLKLATERLTARKKSAVYKRSKTMAQKYT
ncbi:hypothetical protein [Pleurocapsa sp. PCC 7319]|uniref:hypothetical protein n=1 Tax=Pleurocapsa sp. PCC 7319 TaxID=118161 RepID=UPI000348F167|nr:hypothetical protein [Pleurocapsa sp. PCC 7319]